MADGIGAIERMQPNNLNNHFARTEETSVLDHEAFAAKHMPDQGYDVKQFRVFHWTIRSWKQLEKKVTSPEFSCGGHKWRILLFPFGNTSFSPPPNIVSVYLDSANPKGAEERWRVCAQFALAISNPRNHTIYTARCTHHRFVPQDCDWGFTYFGQSHKLFHTQPGHNRPTIEDDSAVVSVYVKVLEDPTGVLWDTFVNYDSKKETGYVGLALRGATSYMNSLLQSLFYTHGFRKAVYQIPTEDGHSTESISLALQELFYRLQTSGQHRTRPVRSPTNRHPDTYKLTKSFGWTTSDVFLPHDVQEFNRVLQDKLEPELKGTRAEGAIANLFEGKMKSSIQCINVNYESYRTEEFRDIQLNIKGMKDLYDSFRDYVSVEMLDGENRYQAGGFGLQDARKSVIFQSFPPVLHLQLKRFKYNSHIPDKIRDRFEFPFEIDLDEFLEETADRSKPWNYKLHSVLVHSGGFYGGRYFALIKPDRDSRWLKFDDDRVIPVTDREVLEENYGGEPPYDFVLNIRGNLVKRERLTTAYMLVYIRESAIDEVLAPLTEEDIPLHLKQRFDEQPIPLTTKIVTDETFARHEGFGLALFDGGIWPLSDLPTFRGLKKETYGLFKSRVALYFGYPENQIRLWVLAYRQKTFRLGTRIPEDEPSLTVEAIHNNNARYRPDLRLYLEILPDPSKLDNARTIIIFLKHFDTTRQSLYGIGGIHMSRKDKVSDLIPIVNERMKWAPGTPLNFYEEAKPGTIKLMEPKYTFTRSEIQDGDIICFQVDISNKEIISLESQGKCSNPQQFYNFMENRVMVLFRPKFDDTDAELPEFSLVLNRTQDYNYMASKVGEHLKHEPIKLRFTTTHPKNGRPKSILKRSLNQSVTQIVTPSSAITAITVILYEKLHVSIARLETKLSLEVVWTGTHNKEESKHLFLSSKIIRVYDLTEHLSKRVQLTPAGTGMIRVFKVAEDGRTRKDYVGFEAIENFQVPVKLFAEEIPREELEIKDHDKIINVFHFTTYVRAAHGVPFKFVVKRGERLSETKKRLQSCLGVSNGDFSRYRFALVLTSRLGMPSYPRDDVIIHDLEFTPDDFLGLNHANESLKARGIHTIRLETIEDMPDPVELFAEEIPREELEAGDHEVTNDFYFTRDVARTLGIPFKFGSTAGPKSPKEVQDAHSAADIKHEQQRYGNVVLQTSILSQVLRDPEPEIARYIDEIDNRLGNHVLLDRERQRLFNELCKTCSRYRVIPGSMNIPDCWEDSVEVEYGCSANVSQSTYKGHRVAVKTFRVYLTSDLDVVLSRFCREGVAWKHLRHPNILPLLGVTVNEHRIAMVSEWMENGNINQLIGKDPHVNRPILLVDVANGVKYLHDLRIVHGDLKGANILINKYKRACIADFGLLTMGGVVKRAAAHDSQVSLISNDSIMSFTAGGTYRWMSPELLYPERFGIPQSEGNRPTRQSDCYAFGMVIYEVLCGHHPYVEVQSNVLVINAIIEGVRPAQPEGAARLGFTGDLWRTVEQCWLEDRSARPDVEDILPFLNDATIHWDTRKFHSSWQGS